MTYKSIAYKTLSLSKDATFGLYVGIRTLFKYQPNFFYRNDILLPNNNWTTIQIGFSRNDIQSQPFNVLFSDYDQDIQDIYLDNIKIFNHDSTCIIPPNHNYVNIYLGVLGINYSDIQYSNLTFQIINSNITIVQNKINEDIVYKINNEEKLFKIIGSSGDDYAIIVVGDYRNMTFDLQLGDGNDFIQSNGHISKLDCGKGVDTIDYSWSTQSAVECDLIQKFSCVSPASENFNIINDISINNCENIIGTQFNDTLIGNELPNVLIGLAGADKINGCGGFDTVDYSNSNASVFVSLYLQKGYSGDAEGDQLQSIENLIGSNYSDILISGYNTQLIAQQDLVQPSSCVRSQSIAKFTLKGGEGNDIIVLGNSTQVSTGNGIDTIQIPCIQYGQYLHIIEDFSNQDKIDISPHFEIQDFSQININTRLQSINFCSQNYGQCIEMRFPFPKSTMPSQNQFIFREHPNFWPNPSQPPSLKCQNISIYYNGSCSQYSCPCGLYLNGTSQVCQSCNISSFINNEDFKCSKCSSSCSDCMFNNSFCLGGCQNGTGRKYQNNQCICDEALGYYSDERYEKCQKCNPVCLTCIDYNSKCLTCNMSDQNRLDHASISNECPCKSHYFESISDGHACIKCHYSCDQCLGFNDICIACPNNTNMSHRSVLPIQNSCPCIVGYYDVVNETNCQKCHYSCETCQLNSTICLTCPNNTKRDYIKQDRMCPCIDGYYDSTTSISSPNIQCQPCHYSCVTCFGINTNCTKCPSYNQQQYRQDLSGFDNTCPCQTQYYDQGLPTCVPCHFTCQECINNQKCTKCDQDKFRYLNSSQGPFCYCQEGFYSQQKEDVNVTNIPFSFAMCRSCQKNCKTCIINPDFCTSCYDPPIGFLKISNTTQTCECIDGYFRNPESDQCSRCSKACTTCSQLADSCLSCNETAFRVRTEANTCSCSKEKKRVEDITTKQCVCDSDYFENAQEECVECSYFCLSCRLSPEKCTSCFNTFIQLENGTCVCQDNQYPSKEKKCKNITMKAWLQEASQTNGITNPQIDLFFNSKLDLTPQTIFKSSKLIVCKNEQEKQQMLKQLQDILCIESNLRNLQENNQENKSNNIEFSQRRSLQTQQQLELFNQKLELFLTQAQQQLDYTYTVSKLSENNFRFNVALKSSFIKKKPILFYFTDYNNVLDSDWQPLQYEYKNQSLTTFVGPFLNFERNSLQYDYSLSLAQSSDDIYNPQNEFTQFTAVLGHIQIFSFIFNSLQIPLVMLLQNTILPNNFYYLCKIMTAFVWSYVPEWQAQNRNYTYYFFNIQIYQGNDISSSWLMTSSFAQLGFSTSYLINNEFGMILLMFSGLIIIIYEQLKLNVFQKKQTQYDLLIRSMKENQLSSSQQFQKSSQIIQGGGNSAGEDQQKFQQTNKIKTYYLQNWQKFFQVIINWFLHATVETGFLVGLCSVFLDLLSFSYDNQVKIFSYLISLIVLIFYGLYFKSTIIAVSNSDNYNVQIQNVSEELKREYQINNFYLYLTYDLKTGFGKVCNNIQSENIKNNDLQGNKISRLKIQLIQLYSIISYTKKILVCFTLVFVYNTIAQSLFLVLIHLFMLIITVILRPYKRIIKNINKIFSDFILLLLFLVILIYNIEMTPVEAFPQDIIPFNYIDKMIRYGEAMIIFLVIFLASNMLFITFLIIEFIYIICYDLYDNVLRPFFITDTNEQEELTKTEEDRKPNEDDYQRKRKNINNKMNSIFNREYDYQNRQTQKLFEMHTFKDQVSDKKDEDREIKWTQNPLNKMK